MKLLRAVMDWWTARVRILALPIFIGIILFQYYQPGLDGALFCKRREPCIQQWVGALSGWAAFGAAIVTAFFLRRQIEDANANQRENVELTIMGRLAAANNFLQALKDVADNAGRRDLSYFANIEAYGIHAVSPAQAIYQAGVRQLRTALDDARIEHYRGQVGLGVPPSEAIAAIDDLLYCIEFTVAQEQDDECGINAWDLEQISKRAIDAQKKVVRFLNSGRDEARLFKRRWETRITQLSPPPTS